MADETPGAAGSPEAAQPPPPRPTRGASCVERILKGIGCLVVSFVGLYLAAVWYFQNAFRVPEPEPVVPELRTVQKTVVLTEGAAIPGHVAASWNDPKRDLATVSISIGAPDMEPQAVASASASGDEPRRPFADAVVELMLGARAGSCTAPCEIDLPMTCDDSCSVAADLFVELLAPPGASASVVVTLAVIPPLKKPLPGGLDAKLDVGG